MTLNFCNTFLNFVKYELDIHYPDKYLYLSHPNVGGAGADPPTAQNRIARNIYFCEIFIELQKSIIKILCHNIDYRMSAS